MTTAAEILANADVKQSFANILGAYDAHRAEEIRAEREVLAALVREEQQRRPRARL
ncbi:hypothetical protein SAMN05216466_106108 [Paraburkholderia phenazinium]|uniref:Uncharacterized protein n=1 Tax=Paraburkholderia phenazinium TaxID=60549 RepID=A0A1G7YAJ0_9BURK|nr:hypothetical protein [Paraburkholderia phenazinium]SDG93502.1 hypothetical protein SAMN05216466_106108 [Paraburkholderia phenazinium]